MAWRKLESFDLAAEYFIHVLNSVLIGFRVLQVKPQEEDAKEIGSYLLSKETPLHQTPGPW